MGKPTRERVTTDSAVVKFREANMQDNDRYAEVFSVGIERHSRNLHRDVEGIARYCKLLAVTPPVEVDCSDVFDKAEAAIRNADTELKGALLALLLSKSQYNKRPEPQPATA